MGPGYAGETMKEVENRGPKDQGGAPTGSWKMGGMC